MDKVSFLTGWFVGRRISGQRKKGEKTPVAYLYNGVRLPPLPEWDTEAYPYAVITKRGDEPDTYTYYIVVDKDPIGANTNGNIRYSFYDMAYIYDLSTGSTWKAQKLSIPTYGRIIWGNKDVLYSDGNVYLSETDPVPVYTAAPKPQLMSFNGLRLPALPYIDPKVYPYVIIGRESSTDDNYRLEASACEAYINRNTGMMYWHEPGERVSTHAYIDGVGWSYLHKYTSELQLTTITEVAWANFDVLNEDGSLYLAASDPVPVYE